MPDESQLQRQILLRLAGNAWVLAPAVVGTTVALGSWAFNARPGISLFALATGVLGSAGVFLTHALLGGPELRTAVERELNDAEKHAQELALDQLDRILSTVDQDPRPEVALRDLRALQASFEELAMRPAGTSSLLAIEVISQVRRLSERGVDNLRQTLELQRTLSRLTTPAAAAPLLAERERLIADVQATVQQLGQTLASLQARGQALASPELPRLRAELEASLDAARRAEERLEQLLNPAVNLPTSPSAESRSPLSGN